MLSAVHRGRAAPQAPQLDLPTTFWADVDDLTKKVKSLISDSRLRQRMGKAGRAETLKWNWQAATSVLRNLQYTRAERNFKGRQRQWRQLFQRLRSPGDWLRPLGA